MLDGVPYLEVADLLCSRSQNLTIDVVRNPFRLKRGGDGELWRAISDVGFEALKASGKISNVQNDKLVRLSAMADTHDALSLRVQRATYYDQARSNLILDYVALADSPSVTLRTELAKSYGKRLPPLNEARLANNVGIACLLFFRDRDGLTPYLVKRVSEIGVMPGGVHCTASGAAAWPDQGSCDFEGFFSCDMYREIKEEVGLDRTDIQDLRPVALCREFLRAGKPQLFFAGITSLSYDELQKRRKKAAEVVKKTNSWPEVTRDTWYQSSQVVIPADEIKDNIMDWGMTLEGIAALHYGLRYLSFLQKG